MNITPETIAGNGSANGSDAKELTQSPVKQETITYDQYMLAMFAEEHQAQVAEEDLQRKLVEAQAYLQRVRSIIDGVTRYQAAGVPLRFFRDPQGRSVSYQAYARKSPGFDLAKRD